MDYAAVHDVGDPAYILGCCIARAKLLYNDEKWNYIGEDLYWHTRERSVVKAKLIGIKTGRLLSMYEKIMDYRYIMASDVSLSPREYRDKYRDLLIQGSKLYWVDVAHPLLIIQEVDEI